MEQIYPFSGQIVEPVPNLNNDPLLTILISSTNDASKAPTGLKLCH